MEICWDETQAAEMAGMKDDLWAAKTVGNWGDKWVALLDEKMVEVTAAKKVEAMVMYSDVMLVVVTAARLVS